MMRFFLVGTDHRSATLRLIADTVFDTRRDALAFLSSEAASSALVGLEEEVYVIDLDVATPVLIVPQQAPGMTDAEEMSAEPEQDDESQAEAPTEPVEPDLAAALKRAAGSLESEGIVAPDPVGIAAPEGEDNSRYPTPYVPEPAAWPWDPSSSEVDGETETSAEADSETETPAEAVDAENEGPVGEEVASEEPGAELESEVETTVFVLDALEEPAVDGTDLVSAPPDDAVYGRTVVMGEYDDEDVPALPIEPMGANGTEGPAVSLESLPEEPSDEDAGIPPLAEVADLESVTPDTLPEEASPIAASAEEEPAPGLTVVESGDTDAYGCDDCVYVNTCPKHHESDPASCGSFQWKTA